MRLAFAFVLCTAGEVLAGEGTASLEVVVQGPDGIALGEANVEISRADGSARRSREARDGLVFTGLTPGRYRVQAAAREFEPRTLDDVSVLPGANRVVVPLPISPRTETVDVSDDLRNLPFTTTLTADQIALLPDDPEEMQRAIEQLAGPGAVIRVNGFRARRLPPKSQIREIRFRTNPYSADMHDKGMSTVDIHTVPGWEGWRGSTGLGLSPRGLNARPAFSRDQDPAQGGRADFSLDVPLRPGATALSFSLSSQLRREAPTGRAVRPEAATRPFVQPSSAALTGTVRFEHIVGKSHLLRAEYAYEHQDRGDLGIGALDLPERAYSTRRSVHSLRVSETGSLALGVVNELLLEVRHSADRQTPVSTVPAVNVLGAFRGGGAQRRGSLSQLDVELADNLDVSLGRHALRAGFMLETGRHRDDTTLNEQGTFTFSSLDAFAAGRPTSFSRRIPAGALSFVPVQLGAYVQDEFQLRSNLSVGVGLRYEVQRYLRSTPNVAPRLAVSWATSGLTFRLGTGVYHDWLEASTLAQVFRLDGSRDAELVVVEPAYPDPGALEGDLARPQSMALAAGLRMPSTYDVSLGAERGWGGGLTTKLVYGISTSGSQFRSRNINAPAASGARPDPSAGNRLLVESAADSMTHRIHANLHYTRPRLLMASFNYTWAWARNETASPLSPASDGLRPDLERGPPDDHAHHLLSGFLGVHLPAGLQAGAALRFRSGTPYSVLSGRDDNGDGIVNDRPPGLGRNTARGAAHWDVNTRLSWRRGFGGRRGVGGAAGIRKVSLDAFGARVDGGAFRYNLQLQVQASNVLNHVNPTAYVGVLGSPLYDRPSSAGPMRRLELSAGFSF
jgi:hypothetical protein